MGCMMMIFGVIVLVVGIAAMQSGQSALSLLLIGFIATLFGFLLWNRLREKGAGSTRFSMFRNRKNRGERKQDDDWEGRFYD